MGWEEVISVILLLILTAVLAVDIPGTGIFVDYHRREGQTQGSPGKLKANKALQQFLL